MDNDMLNAGDSAHVALKPQQYHLLVENQDLLNRDYGGQNGIFADGTVFKAWGMELHPTTGLPTGDFSTDTQYINGVHGENYAFDATNTVALCWIDRACGSATADMISVETEYMARYQADFILGKTTMGHAVLWPGGTAQIRTAAP